ncbi:stress-responsive transcription factor hsf1, partial [Thoreauomyces humboldtii]
LVDGKEHEKYVQWNEAGDVFVVLHCDEFAEEVLPLYFKHSKFPSFVRQLNIYGFYRVSDVRKTPLVRSKEACVFSHKYFKSTRKDLLALIRRKVVPKKPSAVASAESEVGSKPRVGRTRKREKQLTPEPTNWRDGDEDEQQMEMDDLEDSDNDRRRRMVGLPYHPTQGAPDHEEIYEDEESYIDHHVQQQSYHLPVEYLQSAIFHGMGHVFSV